MALTRVTNQVISSNALSAEKIANNTIQSRHLADLSVQARHLATDANTSTDLSAIQSNVVQLQNNLASNVNTVSANVDAVEARRVANIAGAVSTILTADLTASRALIAGTGGKVEVSDVTSTELAHLDGVTSAIQTQIDAVEARRAANLTSATFTGEVTMDDDLIVAGNLTVTGSFANIHVTDAFSNDRIFALANGFTGTPTLDVGLQLNRGDDGNVFVGYDESEDAVAFLHNRDPFSNTLISPTSRANLRARRGVFDAGTIAAPSITFSTDPDTGFYSNAAGRLGIVVDGTEVANVTATGNLILASGGLEGPLNSINVGSRLDLDEDNMTGAVNAVSIQSLTAVGVFLDINDNEATDWFGIWNNRYPEGAQIDQAIFSVREDGNVFVTNDVNVVGNANILLDVTSRGVNLLSNDHATYTKLNANINTVSANVEIRNTQLNANINVVQDNVAVLGGGGTFFKPFMNVNTATGTSNVFFVGQNTTSDDNVLTVTLDGIVQSNSEFVMHHANDTIQFKDASIPSGVKVTILSMIGVA